MAEWLRLQCLRDMKCTVHHLEVMGSNRDGLDLRRVVLLSKSYLNPKYDKEVIIYY